MIISRRIALAAVVALLLAGEVEAEVWFGPLVVTPGTLAQADDDLVELIVSLPIIVAYLWSVAWAANDARARGKPALLVALLVAFVFWPASLAVWIALRPAPRS